MPDNSAYLAFLKDPDQTSRRAELRDFFGPNADKFLRVYDALQKSAATTANGMPKVGLFSGGGGFSGAAMFTGPVWFFYRKMWAAAWTITGLLVLLNVVMFFLPLGRANLPVGVILGLMAYRMYVPHAINTLQKMRRADGTLDPTAVQQAGGVSKAAGWIAGTIYGVYIALALIGIILLARSGQPLQ